MPGRARTTQWLMILIINLIELELAAFLVVVGLGFLSPERRWDMFLDTQLSGITDESIASFLAGSYDADLGWDNVPDTKFSRNNILNEP